MPHMFLSQYVSGGGLHSFEQDRQMLEDILREDVAEDESHGLEGRWRREVANGYVDVLADDHGESMNRCFVLVKAWLKDHASERQRRGQAAEMPAHVLRFLLEHGSLSQEVYACMVVMRSLDERDFWTSAAYWARIVHCLYILFIHGAPHAAYRLSGVLHDTLEFYDYEQVIAARVHEYFCVHGIVHRDNIETVNGYSPTNSVTPPSSEAGD
eukprot:GHVU01200764.1.p1 GENE.GHVU01200764.1~~GHVU01200764.1.p1  ORF type:complete len:212 (+),score=23.78 GHVU01200764.1:66-701(+)